MTQLPTFVFDLDGTLADTNADLLPVLNRIIATQGLGPLETSQIGNAPGLGAKAMITHAFNHHDVKLQSDVLEKLFEEFLTDYEENISTNTRLFEGVENVLDKLTERGHLITVCSNKMEHLALKLLNELGVESRFASILGGNSLAHRKPDPRHIFETVNRAGGEPARAIMIGDSKNDIEAARNAKIPVICVDFGYSDKPIASYQPDAVISHFDELLDAADKLL